MLDPQYFNDWFRAGSRVTSPAAGRQAGLLDGNAYTREEFDLSLKNLVTRERSSSLAIGSVVGLRAAAAAETIEEIDSSRFVTRRCCRPARCWSVIFSGVTKAALDADLSFQGVGATSRRSTSSSAIEVEAGQLVAQLDPTDYAGAGCARPKQGCSARARNCAMRRRTSIARANCTRTATCRRATWTIRALRPSPPTPWSPRPEQQLRGRAPAAFVFAELRSPQACTIAGRYVEPNQNVSAGQPIVRVNCGECRGGRHRRAGRVDRTVYPAGCGGVGHDCGSPGRRFGAVVSEVGVAAERGASAYPVTLLMINENCADIRAGMAAEVRIDDSAAGRRRES